MSSKKQKKQTQRCPGCHVPKQATNSVQWARCAKAQTCNPTSKMYIWHTHQLKRMMPHELLPAIRSLPSQVGTQQLEYQNLQQIVEGRSLTAKHSPDKAATRSSASGKRRTCKAIQCSRKLRATYQNQAIQWQVRSYKPLWPMTMLISVSCFPTWPVATLHHVGPPTRTRINAQQWSRSIFG